LVAAIPFVKIDPLFDILLFVDSGKHLDPIKLKKDRTAWKRGPGTKRIPRTLPRAWIMKKLLFMMLWPGQRTRPDQQNSGDMDFSVPCPRNAKIESITG
jgi:hypothetical protein